MYVGISNCKVGGLYKKKVNFLYNISMEVFISFNMSFKIFQRIGIYSGISASFKILCFFPEEEKYHALHTITSSVLLVVPWHMALWFKG